MIKDKKLQESLKGIFDGEIGIYDVDKFFQQQGVVVDVHGSVLTGKTTLNAKAYGVDIDKDEELSAFKKEHMKDGKISFLPLSLEKKFNTITTSVRQKKKELTIDAKNQYMPIESFKEFSLYVKEQQVKYAEAKDEVIAQWDGLRSRFVNELDIALDKLGAVDKEVVKRGVLAKIPNREQFEENCSIDIEVLAFPTSQNLEILDDSISDEVKESLEKKSLKTVYDILGGILSDAFEVVNSSMALFDERESFHGKTLDKIDKLVERISKKNILRHPVINQLEEQLKMSKYTDDDEIMEALENANVLIYAFAKSIDVDIYLDMSKSFMEESVIQSLSLGVKL